MSLRVAVKLPTVLFDCLGGGLLFAIAARFVIPRKALVAAALFDFNPAVVYDSSLWGQNDSITTVTSLAAVWCMLCGRRAVAWIVLAIAILSKPPVIVLAPLFAIEALAVRNRADRRRAIIQTAIGAVGAIGCGYLLALPFYTDRSIVAVYARMLDWYAVGSSLYPYTSANAFNLYTLYGDFFTPDTVPLLRIPIKFWADAVFFAIATTIYARYTRARDARAFLEACFLVMLAFFLTLTEMHERYLMYALTFAPALATLDRRYLWATLTLTLTEWLNLEYSLTYMWLNSDKPAGVDPDAYAPVLAHLCALANITVFALGMQIYFRPRDTLLTRTGAGQGKP